MKGLESRDSFVANGRTPIHKTRRKDRRGVVAVGLAIVIVISAFAFMFISANSSYTGNISSSMGLRVVSNDLGVGNTTPAIAVDPQQNIFAIAWYGYDAHNKVWNLNVTLIGSTDGSIVVPTTTITNDIAIYHGKPSGMGPRIAWDPDDGVYLLIWYSYNKSLDGIFLNDHAEPATNVLVINGTAPVDYHAFGLSYNGNGFVVSWADTSHRSAYTMVFYNSGNPIVQEPHLLSVDDAHSHVNHASAYSSGLNQMAFVWRNSTKVGSTTYYNITATIWAGDMSSVVYKDFAIADGFTDHKRYDIPNIVGGDHAFFVVYANTSNNGIYGAVLKENVVDRLIFIGHTSSAVKYYGIGLAYAGNDQYLVAWPDSSGNIVATMCDIDGNKVWEKTIVSDGNSNEAPAVAIDTSQTEDTYQFVWYDYTNGIVRTSFWQNSELVPELNAVIPFVAMLLVALAVVRRKH